MRVTGRTVTPPPGRVRVEKGQLVHIQVTGDQADTIHVHGYDLEAELAPGRPATLSFTADQTGLFDVETHDRGLLLAQLAVQ